MKRSALFKRLGGAALILGIVAAAIALLCWLVPSLGAFVLGGCAAALSVVGVKASPAAAGWFFFFVFAALAALRGRK